MARADDASMCARLYAAERNEAALPYCRRAAEQGDAAAQNNIGAMYYQGDGVEQDQREAARWYRMAAEQGHAAAQNNLGVSYYRGAGVMQNYHEAARWYRMAAEQGHTAAQNNLGVSYYYGEGVTRSYREAVKWYRMAAQQGHAWGQNNLGWAYANGEGVITDYREAFIWYSISAAGGDEVGAARMEIMEKKLSRAEVRLARAEAKRRMEAIEAGTYGEEWAKSATSVSPPPSVATAPENKTPAPAQIAYEYVWRSVVFIETDDGQGSGVIVNSHSVATNCHVIENASRINVYKTVNRHADKKTPFEATVRRDSFDRDVCLLDVPGLFGVPARFRRAGSLSVGENVYAVGAPKGYDASLSGGIVSQLRRDDGEEAPVIQTDAAISPGSSGGALVDGGGYVVGITTRKGVGEDVEGITFAIPIEWALEMLE